jgi:hypothetical protein
LRASLDRSRAMIYDVASSPNSAHASGVDAGTPSPGGPSPHISHAPRGSRVEWFTQSGWTHGPCQTWIATAHSSGTSGSCLETAKR